MELDEYLAKQNKPRCRPRHEEADDQVRLVRYIRAKYPHIPIIMSPIFKLSGTKLQRIIQGKRMKDMGYTPGTLDLFFPVLKGIFSGLFLELKTDEGKVSVEQKDIIDYLNLNGYYAAVVRGSNRAIEVFENYMENK